MVKVWIWSVVASPLLVVIITLMVLPVVAAQEDDKATYVVQSGDNLYSIAQAFGSSVETIQAANEISDPSIIRPGQRILIPGFAGISGELAIRPFVAGDTLASLTRALESDRNTLVRLNRIVSPSALYIGQNIIYLVTEHRPGDDTNAGGEYLRIASVSDTLSTVAASMGSSIAGLGMRNALSSLGDVYPGRQIFVPAKKTTSGLPIPLVGLRVLPDHPSQGDPIAVTVQLQSDAHLSGTLGEELLHFVSSDNRRFALHGIHAMADPGTYPLIIHAKLPEGGIATFETRVAISDAQYQYQEIILPQEKSGLLNDYEEVEAEAERIRSIASYFRRERLWEFPFSPPLNTDRITANFGLRRSYNGGPYQTFHSGVDFWAPTDTQINAPASGIVVLAEELLIRGNATVIDHGWGVYTTYWHQSQILVSDGQTVSPGDPIGHVGNSGLSTGTHLHWEVWVGGNQINPIAWLDSDIPQTIQR